MGLSATEHPTQGAASCTICKHERAECFYHANELDETILDRNWATLAVYYSNMARIFYQMFHGDMASELSGAWASDMERWLEAFGKPLAEKAKRETGR